ncbi:CHAT domain-containing protein [Archangium violaceum]|uniref:lipase/acyltransferase domain-containing protein n=1 Tax=Archangium violaceum TaxID=83451 RepID=UPI00194DE706|nr:CHAT domain-containing protein [Archangium violaceum]QRN95667.1 CHAT domain-containing protein [Archangium violaceum]
MAAITKDVVVLLPGLLGSVLERDGKEIWGLSGGAFFRALVSRGGSVESLALKSDSGGELADDGVRATKPIPDVQLLPGFWKVDGYTKVSETLVSRFGLEPGKNFFTFAYDWRRDIRITAKRFAREAERWLHDWRNKHGGSSDSRLILVGHSMGGIVSRYFLECLGGWKHTRALITFGTPHRGSFMALQALALGFRKSLGPVKLFDLSEMVRSLPSAYQLLPTYRCIQMPDGSLVRPGEARGIPNLDPTKAAAGLAFQQEIVSEMESNSRGAEYLERGYALHPVVGIFQPTLQGARLTASGLEMLYSDPDGTDNAGDGTVPRVSAMPVEERHHERAMYSPTSHASLQNAAEVLAHLEGVLTGQRIDLNKYRPGTPERAPRQLSLHIEDAYAHDEPITLRVRPSAELVSPLMAYVTHAEMPRLMFRVPLNRGPDGFYTGEQHPLPPGVYRVSVKGGPEVVPVANVFAVFPREGDLAQSGDDGEVKVLPTQPLAGGGWSFSSSEPGTDFRLEHASPTEQRAKPQAPSTPEPQARDEEHTITRHPSVKPVGPARPGQRLSLTVDLLRDALDVNTESSGITLSGLDSNWSELSIKVRLLCSELKFEPGGDTGEVRVRRNQDSLSATFNATVREGASGELVVVATFEYGGRFCGAARRRIPIESAGTGEPGPSSSEPSSARGGPSGATPVSASPGEASASAGAQEGGTFSLELDAQKPTLTVQIHRLDRGNPRRLYWMLQVGVECEGLPSRLSGDLDLGSDPAEFFQSVATTARELRSGKHFSWFLGMGEQLYDRTPQAFRQTFRALREAYGPGFPIQFITDDPHIPWELMVPSADVPDAGLLCMEHPVARWLLDYQTSLTARLPKGDIVTIAPDYDGHPELAPLPEAQEESRQLVRRFDAQRVTGCFKPVMELMEGTYLKKPVGLLHFAGHGKYSGKGASPSRIYLEDGELETLQVRNSRVKLGQKFRPLVLFNACEVGAANDVLGGMGGWAEAFVSRSFSGFIAPLWPVQDAHARHAVEQLVSDLKESHLTVGEALQRLRQSQAETSPTYLSYVYVGDVMARFAPAVAATRTAVA